MSSHSFGIVQTSLHISLPTVHIRFPAWWFICSLPFCSLVLPNKLALRKLSLAYFSRSRDEGISKCYFITGVFAHCCFLVRYIEVRQEGGQYSDGKGAPPISFLPIYLCRIKSSAALRTVFGTPDARSPSD